jgi:hypothetical protein
LESKQKQIFFFFPKPTFSCHRPYNRSSLAFQLLFNFDWPEATSFTGVFPRAIKKKEGNVFVLKKVLTGC